MIDGPPNRIELGHGIYMFEGDPEKGDSGPYIFLDKILLPCSLPELTVDQIKVINRYRESIEDQDGRSGRAAGSREMFLYLVEELRPRNFLEIGGGKFPIVPISREGSYRGVEIDDDAIAEAHRNGLIIHDTASFERLCQFEYRRHFDLIFGSFSFHFGFNEAFVEAICDALTSPGGVIAFNFISQDSIDIFSKLSLFCSRNLFVRIVKGPDFSKREYLALLSPECSILELDAFARLEKGSWK